MTAGAMPKRVEEVSLPGEYGEAGMAMTVWVNFPNRLVTDLNGGHGVEALSAALKAVVLAHNGWTDFDGNPLPDCQEDGFWWRDEISNELVGVVIATVLDAARRYPKGLRTNGGW